MPDLSSGLYDELVTLALQRRLEDPEDRVTAERLLQVLRHDQVRLGAGTCRDPPSRCVTAI